MLKYFDLRPLKKGFDGFDGIDFQKRLHGFRISVYSGE